ncbi:MAG: M1 family aminopeptidase, partial [Planctomycetota bacterium]
ADVINHEIAHMWFGNLVTMEWFDDLWLKEGFATFIGYSILDELEPDKNAWLRFHQRVKPPAYRVDVTEGTTPVFQELGNLDDAKSNYGAIVYNKAPSILKALETRIGKEDFRQGVRLFLKQHAWGNASWSQLLEAFEKAADEKLRGWSRWWILTAGMPRVRASWKTGAEGTIIAFRVAQEPIQQKIDGAWPMTVPILAMQENGNTETRLIRLDKKETEVPDLLGTPAPAWVLLNHLDTAYGQFLLDERSRDHLLRSLPAIQDPFLRVVAFTAMFETVREAELSPEKFAELAQKMLEDENDPLTHAQVVAALSTTLDRYLDPEKAKPLRSETASMLRRQLRNGELPGLELQAYRALTRLGRDEETMDLFEKVLDGKLELPGLSLGDQDRFLTVAALLAAGQRNADARLASMSKKGDVEKYAYLAGAAAPDPKTKERYFKTYLDPKEPPEQWVQASLGYFHWPGQEKLCLPFLPEALKQVEWVKKHRKIFFMPAWIDSFINAHSSRVALQVAENFLELGDDLPIDIRRKLLQSIDGLRRAVKIRSKQ